VEFTPLDPDGFDELIFPDLRFRVPASLELYRQRLLDAFPAEKRGIDRYVRALREVRILGRADAPRGWKLAWEAVTRGRLAAWYKGATLGAFLDTCTKDQRLRAVIAGQSGDYGVAPGRVSLMLHCGLVNHYLDGAWYPKGGGQVIADGLGDVVEAAGGSIHLRHAVTGIVVEGGRAAGVRWRGPHGEEGRLSAPIVVSNADLKRTWLELLPSDVGTPEQRARAQGWEMGGAIFLTCMAVRADLGALGMRNTNYWQFDDYDFDALYAEGARGGIPPIRGCYITSATRKDPDSPGHAPPGIETVEVMAMTPGSAKAWGVDPADLHYRKAEAYLARKAEIEANLVGRLERLFPGSTREIVHLESATPITHSRFTGASDGSGYGLAATPAQFLENRPGTRGPVPGLYFAGGNTRSGHGIIGALVSGTHAARAISKDA
jgi:phytoene dehydrogenase-like protein